MKKQLIIITLSILIFLGICGCEELEKLNKPNYITVTINAVATVYTVSTNANILTPDINVIFGIIKDGGEKCDFYRLTSESGTTDKVTCSFNLYNKQQIVSFAEPTGVLAGTNRDIQTLSWETVNSSAKMGGSYTWNVHHDLYLSSSG